MASEFVSKRQKELFAEIAKSGELVFACGPSGISANIVGEFNVRHYPEKNEHRIEMGDGEQHVHVNWERVKTVEYSLFHGEGVLTFKDGGRLIKLIHRPSVKFFAKIKTSIIR
jgi:hypothetical protein